MKKPGKVYGIAVIGVLVLGLAAAVIGQAPGPPGGPGGGGFGGFRMMTPAEREKMMQERLSQALTEAGLTEKEKAAALGNQKAKRQAREALEKAHADFSRALNQRGAGDKQIKAALDSYLKAYASCQGKVKAADATLAKACSLKSRAKLTQMGIIENGLGLRAMFGAMMGGGMARPQR